MAGQAGVAPWACAASSTTAMPGAAARIAPVLVITGKVAMQVPGTVITSSPGPTPSVSNARRRAAVPLEVPIAAAEAQ